MYIDNSMVCNISQQVVPHSHHMCSLSQQWHESWQIGDPEPVRVSVYILVCNNICVQLET